MKSEFGKGFVYNLFLFAKHFEREVFIDKNNKEYSLWFYGAADHFHEFIIPKQFKKTPIGESATQIKEIATKCRYAKNITPKQFTEFYNKCEELMILIDKELGLKPIKADWN